MENNELYVTPEVVYPRCEWTCTTTPCGSAGYTLGRETCIDGPGDTPYTSSYCYC